MCIKNHLQLFVLILFFGSCQNTMTEEKSLSEKIKEIPTLIDRGEAIQHGTEWANVQNIYGSNRQKLMQNKDDHEARLKLAEVFINEARITGEHGHYYPAALKMLDGILSGGGLKKDMEFRVLSTKAGVQLSLHQFPKALGTGKKAVKINPHNAQIYGVLTDAYVEMGEYEKAVKMADQMVSIRPDLRSYSRVSYLREIYGDVGGATEAMQMAVSAGHPALEETAWAMLTLGGLQMDYGNMADAKNTFQNILANRPNHPFALGALAKVFIKEKKYADAEKLLNEAKDIVPEVSFYIDLAKIYKHTGREELAENMADEILAMFKDDMDSGHNVSLQLAKVYSDLIGNNEKALECAMAEYDMRPKNIDVNRELAKIYSNMGNMEKAKMHRDMAARTHSKNPELLALNVGI